MPWRPVVLTFGAGLLAVSVGLAGAATLGVLDTKSLGTSSSIVAACDSTIGISWDDTSSPSYSGNAAVANSTFTVSSLRMTGVDNTCDGQKFRLAIADGNGVALTSQSGTLTVAGNSANLSFAATNAKLIEQVTITIYE